MQLNKVDALTNGLISFCFHMDRHKVTTQGDFREVGSPGCDVWMFPKGCSRWIDWTDSEKFFQSEMLMKDLG